jgi:hypothetical protein
MADSKPQNLTATTTLVAADVIAVETGIATTPESKYITVTTAREQLGWKYLTAPLTSTSWDGDAHSTESKTLIDLSAVFSVPAGVRAVLAYTKLRDSGSAAGTPFAMLSPVNTDSIGPYVHKLFGVGNDVYSHYLSVVPCDANGDLYFQLSATGAGTLDVVLEIYGYCY